MKQPTAVIGFAYFAGLLSATLLSPLAVIAVGFAAVAAALLKKVFFGSAYVLMTAAFGCGLLAFSFYQHFFVTPVLSASGAVVPIDGVVTAKTSTDNDSAFYTLSADINGANAKITCFLPDTNAEVGDSVLLTAKLSEISNTAAFAGRDYYSSKGILLTAVPDGEVTVVKRNSFSVSHSLSVLNTAVAERIAAFLPNDYGSMIIAVFLGDNSRMSYDLRDAFKRTGLSHFMSVSGMHVGLLAHIFMSCLLALPLRGGRKLRYALLLLFLTAMSLFFGLSPSVLRSSLMLAVFYGADITLRRRRTLNSMGAALLIILLINPSAAADPGLVLSFAGTFGVGIMAPAIMSRMKTSSFSKLKNLVVVSVSANICTLPFSALYFGGVSLVSVP
ncbi:MAG: ComEC/Rec2 family competence protein, partial [Oscillospiraceae bacterium]|nr:ComEC/Rec2 family competence protein [Oscillospiraceae bacterium]